MAPPPLTPAQLQQFETEGYVTIDALEHPQGLSAQQLQAAEDTFDRLVAPRDRGGVLKGKAALAEDEGFVDLITHPFFEAVAKQVIRSESVRLIELGPHHRPPAETPKPTPEEARSAWSHGCHVDLQITTSDFNATPRRDLLAIWFWVNDVPADRAAMRILPGSHVPIQAHWEKTLLPERRKWLPRVHGLNPQARGPAAPEFIPEPAEWSYTEAEPMPVVVKRGTAQIFTQSMLHSGWHNSTEIARKGFIIGWAAADVPVGFVRGASDRSPFQQSPTAPPTCWHDTARSSARYLSCQL
jgi:ectoine hydroxylase-related dioxygenase (phytanoyl-CoA dioxygenase family)